jgi:hypothetical protein
VEVQILSSAPIPNFLVNLGVLAVLVTNWSQTFGAVQDRAQSARGILLHRRQRVRVDLQRHADVLVTEPLLRDMRRNTRLRTMRKRASRTPRIGFGAPRRSRDRAGMLAIHDVRECGAETRPSSMRRKRENGLTSSCVRLIAAKKMVAVDSPSLARAHDRVSLSRERTGISGSLRPAPPTWACGRLPSETDRGNTRKANARCADRFARCGGITDGHSRYLGAGHSGIGNRAAVLIAGLARSRSAIC